MFMTMCLHALSVKSLQPRLRYIGVEGGTQKITARSQLLFKWRLELADEQVKSVDLQIRADNAFDRGIHVPASFAEISRPSSEASQSSRFTPTAAREAAKDATHKARHGLGVACRSVECRPPSPTSIC